MRCKQFTASAMGPTVHQACFGPLAQRTFASGAKQFVVHEAFDTTSILLLSYCFSLTPITNIGASFEGAEMMTCIKYTCRSGLIDAAEA